MSDSFVLLNCCVILNDIGQFSEHLAIGKVVSRIVHDASTAAISHRDRRGGLHQRRRIQHLRIAVQPLHRHEGARARVRHHHLHALEPRRDAYERGHGAARLRAAGRRAGRHAGKQVCRQRVGHPQARHLHPALRLLRARFYQHRRALRGRGLRLRAPRGAHQRDHRRREGLQKRYRHPVH